MTVVCCTYYYPAPTSYYFLLLPTTSYYFLLLLITISITITRINKSTQARFRMLAFSHIFPDYRINPR